MPPLVIRLNAPRFRKRVAAFDYDWTLVRPQGRRVFPRNVADWQWLDPEVPERVRAFYQKGYMVVVVTNQSLEWKVEQIRQALGELGIPITAVVARDRTEYKPFRGLWDAVVPPGKNWDREASFFVGDAAGRPGDYADTDRLFAEEVGLRFRLPEEVLLPARVTPVRSPSAELAAVQRLLPREREGRDAGREGPGEIVVMVGYPGSGKSTIAREVFGAAGYKVLSGDVLKTRPRMVRAAAKALDEAAAAGAPLPGVVFDATHPSREARAELIRFAQERGMKARCVHVATDWETSYARNMLRAEAAQVPKVGFVMFEKRFEAPTEAEGCQVDIV